LKHLLTSSKGLTFSLEGSNDSFLIVYCIGEKFVDVVLTCSSYVRQGELVLQKDWKEEEGVRCSS
jgi:hypothetical protein